MSHAIHYDSVLVVDDDFVLLGIVTAVLERAGVAVQTASSGEAALTMLREHRHKIGWLMTDINLPGLIDGYSVAEAYRSFYSDRPIIYLSATECEANLTASGSFFVKKPLHLDELIRLANRIRLETSKAA